MTADEVSIRLIFERRRINKPRRSTLSIREPHVLDDASGEIGVRRVEAGIQNSNFNRSEFLAVRVFELYLRFT